jgi:hypothetical protein
MFFQKELQLAGHNVVEFGVVKKSILNILESNKKYFMLIYCSFNFKIISLQNKIYWNSKYPEVRRDLALLRSKRNLWKYLYHCTTTKNLLKTLIYLMSRWKSSWRGKIICISEFYHQDNSKNWLMLKLTKSWVNCKIFETELELLWDKFCSNQ